MHRSVKTKRVQFLFLTKHCFIGYTPKTLKVVLIIREIGYKKNV